jgi:chromate transporter
LGAAEPRYVLQSPGLVENCVRLYVPLLEFNLWIFLGGPYIEKLRGNEALTTTLSAVTAAVVGVVLNLAVWFGLHVIFPSANVVDWFAVVVGLAAFVAMIKWKLDIIPVVLGAGLLGLIFKILF